LIFTLAPIEKSSSSGFAVDDWVIECVDCPRYFDNLTNRSAVLDANELPHVAYGGDHLYYGYLDGDGEWQSEVVDVSARVGFSTAMVLDSNGHPHILYRDSSNSRYKYASYDGADWQIEPFPFGSLLSQLSLVIDSSDKLHVSFFDGVNDDLIYGVHIGTGWFFEIVDSNGEVGLSSIALDGNDLPHISYHDVTNTQLKYAFFDGIDWTIQAFPEENQHGYDTDLTIDQDGYAHIVYRGIGVTGIPALMYRFQDIAGWHLEIVDESSIVEIAESVGHFNSIDIDYLGEVHVSYSAIWNSISPYPSVHSHALRYAHRTSVGWEINQINTWYAENSTLLVHNSGNPSIVYKADNDLRYASKTSLGWGEITLEPSEFVGKSSSLDMVFLDQPHISYYDQEGSSIKYAARDSSGWSVQRIDSAGRYAYYYTVLSLSPNGNPHLLYAQYGRMGDGLRHAYIDGDNWMREIVWDYAWSPSLFPAATSFEIAVDAQGNVHAVDKKFLYPWDWIYLYRDDAWMVPEAMFYNGSSSSGQASITTSPTGQIHVALTGDGLKYGVKNQGGWSIDTVDSGGFASPSIDLDKNGFPHISYRDDANGDLKYANFNGISWETEFIDTVGDVGSFSSLGMDLQDFAHIAYYDATNGDLKYAYYNGSEWEINTLVSEGDVGSHCSLVLDIFGNPYITFHDAGLGDLKIIYKPHGTVYRQFFPFISR
jgi:hypothetical protein